MWKKREVWAVVVAAGRGRRMAAPRPTAKKGSRRAVRPRRAGRPKALVPLGGKPLFLWSVDLFASVPAIDGILVTAPPDKVATLEGVLARHGRTIRPVWGVIPGGRRRQDSVRKALEWCQGSGLPHDAIVLIHDAARPLLDVAVVRRCLGPFGNGRFHGCVVPVLAVEDTLKRVRGRRIIDTLDRKGIARAQTPQALLLGLGLALHHVAREEGVLATDEASLAEHAGLPVRAVPGDPENLKITTPWDLHLAENILRSRRGEVRPRRRIDG